MYEYKAKLKRVIDGDTIEFTIDLGFGIFMNRKIRLLNVDTPEIFHPSCEKERVHGLEATEFVKDFIKNDKKIIIKTHKDHKGKYGRILAEVFCDDISLNQQLIVEGFQKRIMYE
jgi:micrococcal nuclease